MALELDSRWMSSPVKWELMFVWLSSMLGTQQLEKKHPGQGGANAEVNAPILSFSPPPASPLITCLPAPPTNTGTDTQARK